MTSRPRIAMISFGGTIASSTRDGAGATPNIRIAEIAATIPQIAACADLDDRPSKLVASSHMTFEDVFDVRCAVEAALADGCDGVVVTQGTDTVEEIAFGLDLVYRGDAPVVITAAMRNASMAGADGPANLLAAVRVAASREARGLGVVVVVADEIHAARFVRKAHTASPATFRSDATGPLGWLAEGDIRILTRPARRLSVAAPGPGARAPAVCLLKMALGDDARLLPLLAGAGFAGLVIEGFGGGHVTPQAADPAVLAPLIAAMPVVLSSRAGSGEVLRATYSFPGSEIDLLEKGLISAGALDGPKSRVLLTLLLAAGASRAGIATAFAEIGPLAG